MHTLHKAKLIMDHLVCISVNNVCVCVYPDAIFTSVLCVGLNLLESNVNNVRG